MMEVVVTTGLIKPAKLQSNCHYQQTNTELFTGRMPFVSPNQQGLSTEGIPYNTKPCRWLSSIWSACFENLLLCNPKMIIFVRFETKHALYMQLKIWMVISHLDGFDQCGTVLITTAFL